MLERILQTRDDWSTLLIRLAVGLIVFFPEGLQKLLFPAILGAGRFAAIGIPWPEVLGPFVGVVEIVCGAAIILGLLTRLAVIPLMIVLIVALLSTKVPILLGHDLLIFNLPHINRYGFWSMEHEARLDLCMLLACGYLLVAGSGAGSIDTRLQQRHQA